MDYQIVFKFKVALWLFLLISLLHCSCAILNRDIVLTPKQGLQLSGKRIFYDEDPAAARRQQTEAALHNSNVTATSSSSSSIITQYRPWERTLKHVTYLTLFTNTPNGGIITGNFSKLKEYNDFLNSTYIPTSMPIDSRFGDIITLSQGRVESMHNGSYRFYEGDCNYECARKQNTIAMWHVQKIRHRDAKRKFSYEMKFSISPISEAVKAKETVVRGGPNKRENIRLEDPSIHTFIQKEDDYPYSFGEMPAAELLDRRLDAGRSFRQVPAANQLHQHNLPGAYKKTSNYQQSYQPSNNYYQNSNRQITPIPESTFLHGVFKPPPPPPTPERLNIGEFYHGATKGNFAPKGSSKIELFPSLLSMMLGTAHNLLAPPLPSNHQQRPMHLGYQQMKYSTKPEIFSPPIGLLPLSQEYTKYPESPYQHGTAPQLSVKIPSENPMVSHHFHHHFYGSGADAAAAADIEEEDAVLKDINQSQNIYKLDDSIHGTTAPYYTTNRYGSEPPLEHTTLKQSIYYQNKPLSAHQMHLAAAPPAPQKFVFPTTQIEEQRVIHVTPVTPLRKPQHQTQQYYHAYTHYPEISTAHGPLQVIYPAPVEEKTVEYSRAGVTTNKPFLQSEFIQENGIRYSEPDPLYAQEDKKQQQQLSQDQHSNEAQTEPQLESPQEQYDESEEDSEERNDSKNEQSDSIEAQLPAPNKNEEKSNRFRKHKDEELNTERITTTTTTTIKSNSNAQRRTEQKTSQSKIKISTEKPISTTAKTEAAKETTTTQAHKILPSRPARRHRVVIHKTPVTTTPKAAEKIENQISKGDKTINQPISTASPTRTTTMRARMAFVSTSTSESPLRAIAKYRSTVRSTTTSTEKPVLKWKPKRKAQNGKALQFKSAASSTTTQGITQQANEDNDDEEDEEHQKELQEVANTANMKNIFLPTIMPDNNDEKQSQQFITSSTTTTPLPDISEIYEVLTQKSVSKSVSLKRGPFGEDIPIIIDDEENEVKKV